ncbi:hypothetical protein GCM10008955_24850 [Deinococcus malanensis]|uniref:Uncharacterized protein n=1 Tax=Deinococcus malanensis TaxID=1706855 RepID=A0ABQ2EWS8_9DEIO|nr:hypothetical protein [Deinococcus malanensis]GGK30130.1 hypothetical protein GCM10008955_24850 [Deinococcus malanensis]
MDHVDGRDITAAPDGRVYVMRIWREGSSEAEVWRASVREGTSGERRYFTSLDDCLDHLYMEFMRP